MLENIKNPEDLKQIPVKQLDKLAQEAREKIIGTISERGGHLASNLGSVELTIALHYVFNAPEDKILFDVGHQAYTHKLLTGRYEQFSKIRTLDGISGFPQATESEYDTFTAGHASTAISAALGIARSRDIMNDHYNVVAVVGDGALSGGMCYEALNDAGQRNTKLIVILNDNAMSIAPNVGAMSRYLTHLRQSKTYRAVKRGIRRGLEKIPRVGNKLFHFLERLRNTLKSLFIDGRFFDALGFEYIGPIGGHDIKHMIRVFERAKDTRKPVLIHIVTQKGKGYAPAEAHPDTFHGVAPFFVESGESKRENGISCGSVASRQLAELAETDMRICAVTAAMGDGTKLNLFAQAHKDRYFDVGIAEEHAVTMAAGMASEGLRPYVAIYSTFLQRAYDQMLMDVCRPELPVIFLIDRAGLVGEDGATHQGVMDLSYLRSMPNMIVAAPRDIRDLKKMIDLSQNVNTPMAIRYPKSGEDLGPRMQTQQDFKVGEWEVLNDGEDIMIFAVGRMVQTALQAAIELMGRHIGAGVIDARFVKPMDLTVLRQYSGKVKMVVTIEENVAAGGFGEGVMDALAGMNINVPLLPIAVPDTFIPQGTIEQQTEMAGLDVANITRRIGRRYEAITACIR